MNAAQRRARQRQLQPTTTNELATLGDDIRSAQQERAERQAAQLRMQRQRDRDRRLVARLDPAIKALESELSAKRAVVDKLNEERAELAARIEATPTPAAQDARDIEDIDEALRQAVTDGAQLISGVSMHEGGGTTPKHVRVPHPRLVEADPDLDWAHPVEALQQHLDEVKLERDAAARRLGAVAA